MMRLSSLFLSLFAMACVAWEDEYDLAGARGELGMASYGEPRFLGPEEQLCKVRAEKQWDSFSVKSKLLTIRVVLV